MTQLNPIARWHALLERQSLADLPDLIAADAVFHSPVVHTPQRGGDITIVYLGSWVRCSRRARSAGARPVKCPGCQHENRMEA